jgi:hypothetical protein
MSQFHAKIQYKTVSVFSVPRWQILIGSRRDAEAQSYEEIGEYWDAYDLAEHWEETKPAKFEVDIQSEATYYAVERELSETVKLLLNGAAYRRIMTSVKNSHH